MSQEVEVKKAIRCLKSGGVILYPSDTIWGLGCDATNAKAVHRIFRIKKREAQKSLIVLVSSREMLMNCIYHFPEKAEELLANTQKPLTIIYERGKNLARNVPAEDGSIAIRMVTSGFCHDLIERYGKPVVSTSANISNQNSPASFLEIDKKIVKAVDYVVDSAENARSESAASKIVKFTGGKIIVLRD